MSLATVRARGSWGLAFLLVLSLLWVLPARTASAVAPTPGQFMSLAPARILDTRGGIGGTGPVMAGATVSLQVAGQGGVPATGAGAVVLNVTVTDTTSGGYVTVYPSGTSLPLASNLNFAAGETIPNLVVAKLGTDGRVNLTVNLAGSYGSASLVADVAGYLVAGTASEPGAMVVQSPSRILDTRENNGAPGPLSGGSPVSLQVAGRGGVPSTGADAVVLNVTATGATAAGWVAAYPSGTTLPLASNLNFVAGQTIPNLVIVKLGADGKVNLAAGMAATEQVSLVADVEGYILAGTATANGSFAMQAPARILDTRTGVGGFGPIVNGSTLSLQVTGRKGIPSSGVAAVILNVTVTDTGGPGYVTVHPSGTNRPTASNLNFTTGRTIPNLVIAKVGADGKVNLSAALLGTSTRLSLVADVAGYILTDAPNTGVVAWGVSVDHTPPAPATPASAIAAGVYASLSLRSDGVAVGWGSVWANVVDDVPGTHLIAISAGMAHGLALRSDGTVMMWGDNYSGQATVPVGLTGVTAIAAGGSASLALKSDGTVVAWGDPTYGQMGVPVGLTGVIAISVGMRHSLALKSDGTVVAWGNNQYGQTNVPAGLTGVKAISAGDTDSLALKTDGTVVGWGSNTFGESAPPSGLTGVTAIAAGGDHSLALKGNGAVVIWGSNANGPARLPADLVGITAIAAGSDRSLALTADGTIVAWNDIGGQLYVPGSLVGPTAVSAGGDHYDAVRTDGTVVEWGSMWGAVPVGLTGVTAIAAGGNHTVALKKDGTVVAWGSGEWFSDSVDAPAGLSGVIAVAAGDWDCLALKSNGTVVSWGQVRAPVPTGLSGVTAIASGGGFSLALRSDGTVVAWGLNDQGQTNVPIGLSGVIAISAGESHSLALKSDGTVVAWGYDGYGGLNVPAGLSGVTAIAAGQDYNLVLKDDGTLVAWGSYAYNGPTTIPPGLTGIRVISAGPDNVLAIAQTP